MAKISLGVAPNPDRSHQRSKWGCNMGYQIHVAAKNRLPSEV